MKRWNNPEMKLYSLKLNENIAASGTNLEKVNIVVFRQTVVEKQGTFWCNGTNIQDTGVNWTMGGYTADVPCVDRNSWGAIQGCLA